MPSQTLNATAILLKGEKTCTLPAVLHEALPLVNNWTFHKIITAVAIITTGLTLLISLANIARHLFDYTRPNEQRHIVRILLTPLIFSLFNALAIGFYEAAAYLTPVAQLYEVFAVVAIFLLFLAFVCPDPREHEAYFANLERRDNKQKVVHDHGSLRWFYYIWIMVFQILPARLLCSIATWIIHAVLCPLDPKLGDASIVIEVFESVFTVLALMSLLRFYRRLREPLKSRNAIGKLVVFKIMIFISIVQTPVFSGLLQGGVLSPSEHISYQDWSIGVPAFCTCCEMFIFSLLFLWPFSAKQYSHREPDAEKLGQRRRARLGFFAALLDSLNILDVIRGAFFHKKVVGLFKKQTTYMKGHRYDQMPMLTMNQPGAPQGELSRPISDESQ